MIMHARSGKQHQSHDTDKMRTAGRTFRPAPLSAALALALAGGALVHAPAHAAGAWFAQPGAGKAQSAANIVSRPLAGLPARTAAQQQQQSRQQLQRSLDNLGRTASAIAAQQAAQRAAREAAQNDVSVPDGYQAGGLWDKDAAGNALAWSGAERPRQTAENGKTTVAITQTSAKAILNWDTFNVGRNTAVHFEQQSDWAVLNRVNDPQQRPSQIQGQIQGDGTVMLVNRNGIVFSGSSQVNVRNLVAAAVGMTDEQFAKGIYGDATGDTPGFRTYMPSFGNDLGTDGTSGNAEGGVTVQAGAQISTATPPSATRGGGYVLMLGRDVSNAGTIQTPGGQALLAAGDSFVIRRGYNTQENPLSTTRGNEVAPRINAGSQAGAVSNSGLMLSRTGDITLAGRNVVQQGVAVATTDVNARGTVHLLNSATDASGSVTLAPGNVTAVLVDEDAATAFDAQWDALSGTAAVVNRYEADAGMAFDNLSRIGDQASLSRIEVVSGGTVDFQDTSLTLATGGQITVSAGVRSLVRSGADLDVSGAVGVRVAMESNNIQVNVQGNEQRDAPVNRDSGTLNNLDVWVDRRQLVFVPAGTNGYATDRWYTKGGLLEVGGYVGTVGHTAGEWLAQGGSVTFGGNDVVTQQRSRINLSGGTLDVQSGYINMSWLRGSDGRLYELSSAPGDILYTGYYQGYESVHERWGEQATRRFYNPVIAPTRRFESGYTVGRDAGKLVIATPSAVLEGSIINAVFDGDRQYQAPQAGLNGYKQPQTAMARAAQLILARYNPNRVPGTLLDDADFTEMASHVLIGEVAQDIASRLDLADAVPTDRQGTIRLDSTALNQAGLGSIVVGATETVDVQGRLQVLPGGEIILHAPQIGVGADLVARSGTIHLGDLAQRSANAASEVPTVTPTDPETVVGVTLAPGVTLDARGLWSNLLQEPNARGGLAYVDGGDVSIRSSGAVSLGENSAIDVSSGAAMLRGGSFQGGAGGNVTLSGFGNLVLGGDIRGYGVKGGGSLTIESGTPVGLGGEILEQAGILQAGEVAPTDMKVLEDFVVVAGEILPADFTYLKTRAQSGTIIAASPEIDPAHPVEVRSDWTPPFAIFPNSYIVEYTYQGIATSVRITSNRSALIPAGALVSRISGGPAFPKGWTIDPLAFPDGLPITPTDVVARSGEIAPQDAMFAAGTIIRAGATLSSSVVVESPLSIAPDTLSKGFASYVVRSERGIAVPDGAALNVVVPTLRPTAVARDVSSDADVSAALAIWTPPVFLPNPISGVFSQRTGGTLALKAYGGNIAVGGRASIEVDPGQSITLEAGDQNQARISVDGVLRAPGGNIRLGALSELADRSSEILYDGGSRVSIRVGSTGVLNVAGVAVTATDQQGRTYGELYDGGTISLDAGDVPDTFIVIEQGAILDASGSAVSVTRPGVRNSQEMVTLGSDGGTLSFASRAGLYLAGSMMALPGGEGAAGGMLNLTLDGALYKPTVIIPDDVRHPAEITVVRHAISGSHRGISLNDDGALAYGQARIGVDQIEAGEFDNISLYARDLITFDGDIELRARQGIQLHEGILGNTTAGANVSLVAPYVLLSGRTLLASLDPAPPTSATLNTWNPSQQESAASLSVDADRIDIRNIVRVGYSGSVALNQGILSIDRRGYGLIALHSRGDIQLLAGADGATRQLANDIGPQAPFSALLAPGDVVLAASRIYPSSHSYGLVAAGVAQGGTYDPESSIRIERTGGETQVPMSVFGQLELRASAVVQGGALYAPLGRIAIGDEQTKEVKLLPGSLTSVSAAGLVVPYGGTLDNITYTHNGTAVSAIGVGGMAYALNSGTEVVQGVSFTSASVMADAGAVIDLSGGGELAGAAFISGRGGSTDPLYTPLVRYDYSAGRFALPSLADNPVYAILPGFQGGYAPVTPQDQASDYAGSLPSVGQQVTIGTGGPGLPSGTYTLLPSFYALLPGAYRVELGGTATNWPNAAPVVALRNGSWSVPVATGIANTDVRSVLRRTAIVTSGKVLRQYGQYNETGYSEFIRSTVARTGTPRPMLPEDAKTLQFRLPAGAGSEQPALAFDGTVNFAPAAQGHGGQVIVGTVATSVPLEIIGSTPTPGFTGASVRAEDLNALGAARISIGGWLYGYGYPTPENDPDIRLRVGSQTGDVYVRGGATLHAAEVQLITGSSGRIRVEHGASIDTLGQGAAPYDSTQGYQYSPSINANMLVVSNGWLDVLSGIGAGTGGIEVGVCASGDCTGNAELYSDGSIVFASNNVAIGEAARFGTRNLTMAVSGLNIGTEAALAEAATQGVLPAGLQLPQSLLSRLLSGDPERRAPALERLIFSVRNSVNLFGTVALTTADAGNGQPVLDQLVFNTPAIYGHGGQGDVATISTGTLVWNGAPGAVASPVLENGPGTGLGTLTLQADRILLGYAEGTTPSGSEQRSRLALGFSTVNLNALDRITANGEGDLSVYQALGAVVDGKQQYTGGRLNLNTPLLTGEAGSVNHIETGGALALTRPDGATARTAEALGGTLTLQAQSVMLDSTVALPSGKFEVTADGDLALGANAQLDMAGRDVAIGDQVRYSWGGDVKLESTRGNILQAAGSVIDLSARFNEAGTLTATAVDAAAGRIALLGDVRGGASGLHDVGGTRVPFDGGGIVLAGQTIDDLAGLNVRLTEGGVTGLRSFRIKQGDLVLGSGIRAREVVVSVDGGSLTVDGAIDASGVQVGSIRLSARDNLTLTGNAVLDAHGTGLRVDSYGKIIDAPNRAIVDLTSGADGSGTLMLQAGATIDLRAGTDVPLGSSAGQNDGRARGTLALNVPRMGMTTPSETGAAAPDNATGGDLDISAAGPVTVLGARSIAVYGYASYANARPDAANPGTQIVDQAYLDQIDADSRAFIGAAYAGNVAAGALNASLQAKLAGLTAYGGAFHLRPGVEIRSATDGGSLMVAGDLDLSGYRYGPNAVAAVRGSGEPGALSLRAAGNLDVNGSINDGFALPPSTPDDYGWQVNEEILLGDQPSGDTERTWLTPIDPVFGMNIYYFPATDPGSWETQDPPVVLSGYIRDESDLLGIGTGYYGPGDTIVLGLLVGNITIGPGTVLSASNPANADIAVAGSNTDPRPVWAVAPMLPAGSLSWDIRLGAGADLAAADRRALRTAAQLNGRGNIALSDEHFQAGTQRPVFSVVRTGTGDLDILAGGSFRQDSLYGVYTAGTPSAPVLGADGNPVKDAWGRDAYNLPRGQSEHGSVLGAGSQYESLVTGTNYSAWYPEQGGNVSVVVQGDLSGDIFGAAANDNPAVDPIPTNAPSNYVGNWLWRQGGAEVGQATAWWINFGTYVSQRQLGTDAGIEGFTGLGTLGGGNLQVRVGGDAGVLLPSGNRTTRSSDGLTLAVGATGRMVEGELLLTGGGDLLLDIGGAFNPGVTVAVNGNNPFDSMRSDLNGVLANLRGSLAVSAGNIGRVAPRYGVADASDPRAVDALRPSVAVPSGGPVLVVGDAAASLNARGDLALDGVADPGRQESRNNLPFGANDGGGVSWYTLWTGSTGVDLFSAGGNLTPVSAQHYAPGGGLVTGNDGFNVALTYPAQFSAIAAQGSIYYSLNPGSGAAGGTNELAFAPSPAGQSRLELLAADSVYGGGFPFYPSSVSPRSLPTPARPAFIGRTLDANQDILANNTVGTVPYVLAAFGANTADGSLYRNDPDPIRVYAGTGDVVGVTLGRWSGEVGVAYGSKAVHMVAGRDIVNSGGFFLNNNPTDISMMAAGRDIFYANVDVGGPGLLEVTAGRNLYQADQGRLSSVGLVNGAEDRTGGAGIVVTVGTGAHAVDYTGFALRYLDPANLADPARPLADQAGKVAQVYGDELTLAAWLAANHGYDGPDDGASAQAFLQSTQASLDAAHASDGSAARRDLQRDYQQASQLHLVNWLRTRFGYDGSTDALTYFKALPAQQQRVYARNLYYAELRAAGREFNDADGPRFHSYLRGRNAIALLFPETDANGLPIAYQGDLTLFQGLVNNGGIRTVAGGDIQVLAPGGRITIGVEGIQPAAGPEATPAGLVTQGSGNIQLYSQGSILLGLSRIMTSYGGDISAWSAHGDINAGRGAKTTVVYTPLLRAYDDMGNVTQSPSVPATGAGVSVQNPIPEVPAGDVDLIAPEGTIDAGEAGIRASGNVNVAALQVVNAANIRAQGETTGVPVIAAVNVGALTAASSAATSAATAAQDMMRAGQNAARQSMPSIISVQILGFGDDGSAAPAAPAPAVPPGAQTRARPAYDASLPMQVVGLGNNIDVRALTPQERRLLKQDQ